MIRSRALCYRSRITILAALLALAVGVFVSASASLVFAPRSMMRISGMFSPVRPVSRKPTKLTVTVLNPNGKPFNGATVTAGWTCKTPHIAPGHGTFSPLGSGKYVGTVRFSAAGVWAVIVHIKAPHGLHADSFMPIEVAAR